MLLAEIEGEPAGYAWICTQPESAAAASHGLTLGPGECLHWSSATFEEFRRRGVYTSLQRFSRAYMKAHGYKRVYGGADTRNPAPLRMIKNLGLKPVRLRHLRCVLRRTQQWNERVPPDFSV